MIYDKEIIVLIFAVVILILPCFSGCLNDEHCVTILDSEKSFKTISEAITQAEEGDTILVGPGVYHESLVIKKSVILKGKDRDKTIISGYGTDDLIYIVADNVTIIGFTISNSGNNSNTEEDAGIDIRSEHNTIKNVNFSQNSNYGIYMYKAHNNGIENCIFLDNVEGGVFSLYCNENIFQNNTLINNTIGLYLKYNYNTSISDNTISSHSLNGIYLYDSEYNMIDGNIFTENNRGIHVKGSKHNTIKENLFINNERGLYLCCGGENNLIYQNVFMKNDEHAYGYPINQFDNGTVGNYWDDYNGTDEDGDGIGDTSYNATTGNYGVRSKDRYPLMSP